MDNRFRNRETAGERLADQVAGLGLGDPVVLALPRGGVPVAVPVARRLTAPLDLIMVRKIGVPGHQELAMGAVVDGAEPEVVWNTEIVNLIGPHKADCDAAVARQLDEIAARRSRYLRGRAPVAVKGRDAVVVDDGIATGATVRAALKALRRRDPASVTLAVPVAPRDTCQELVALVDHLVCLQSPEPFFAVGAHYVDFRETVDDEVIKALGFGEGTERDA